MLEPERMIAHHTAARLAWVRAAALRANGGIVALGALLIGVAAAATGEGEVLLAGLAGLVAGTLAITMAEYAAAAGTTGGAGDPVQPRGVDEDPVVHHRRGPAEDLVPTDRGGLADYHGATALQAALTSGAAFALGGALPLAAASAFKLAALPLGVGLVSLAAVALLAVIGARTAGMGSAHYAARATGFAAIGLATAFAVGRILGTAVA